jgi:benzoyl-CoA 2,3-dioxygenase component B
MLTEEAFHMFVGESGIGRVLQRTCEAMNQAGIKDPYDIEAVRGLGVIDLPTIQKKANFHCAVTLDLFGSEVSTNAATAFEAGIKGRFQETKIDDDHQLHDGTYPVLRPADDGFETVEEPALNALNARLRDDYLREVEGGFKRWNKVISKTGVDFELAVPHQAFNRRVGHFHEMHVTPQGEILTADTWQARKHEWLPSDGDLQFISSLMKPVTEPGRYAGWIAEPKVKVDSKPGEFEFVRLAS